jgi:uncharacterized membrane protein YfcA
MTELLIILGFTVGLLVGLTGVGGGSLMTPLLVSLGLNPLLAVGTDLLYSVPTKLFGWYLHRKQGTMNTGVVKALCIGGIPGALLGLVFLFAATHFLSVHEVELIVRKAIGVAVVLSALMVIASPFILKGHKGQRSSSLTPAEHRRLVAVGAGVGFTVAATSIGGGALALPLILMAAPGLALPEIVGADIAFSAILVLISAGGQWKLGNVSVPITASLLTGSLVGVYFGSRLCKILAQQWLRPALAVVLIVAGARLV